MITSDNTVEIILSTLEGFVSKMSFSEKVYVAKRLGLPIDATPEKEKIAQSEFDAWLLDEITKNK